MTKNISQQYNAQGDGERRRQRFSFWFLVGPAVVVFIWQVVHSLAVFDPSLLPAPWTTLAAFVDQFSSGAIFPHLFSTILRTAAGYALASVVGIAAGLLMGASRPVYESTVTVVDFFRSIPVTSLYPVFVLTLGVSHISKIGMVFFASLFIVALQSAYGVHLANQTRRKMAQLYGASRWQVFRLVVFPEALPQTMIGLRIALSYSLIVAVVCEMFMGSETGLGQRIIETYTTYAIPDMYAIILITGILGFGLNRAFEAIEERVIGWAAN